jgi:hypothetical protein
VIVRFVDIGGVIDHHCLKFDLIILIETKGREILLFLLKTKRNNNKETIMAYFKLT